MKKRYFALLLAIVFTTDATAQKKAQNEELPQCEKVGVFNKLKTKPRLNDNDTTFAIIHAPTKINIGYPTSTSLTPLATKCTGSQSVCIRSLHYSPKEHDYIKNNMFSAKNWNPLDRPVDSIFPDKHLRTSMNYCTRF